MIARQGSTASREMAAHRGARAVSLLALVTFPIVIVMWWRNAALSGLEVQLFEVFDTLVLIASVCAVVAGRRSLRRHDWVLAMTLGIALGALVTTTGFYPLLGWLLRGRGLPVAVSLAHGAGVAVALLAGIVAMRRGGPVALRFSQPQRGWRAGLQGLGFGAAVGLPLAVVNAYANTLTQGRPFELQRSLVPLLEALEPGVVEEVVYRFALLGLLALLLQPFWGERATWLAGAFALVVHSYAHNGQMLLEQPLMYLAFGAVLALLWGVPLTVLAVRRGLEAAAGFHWVQDAARFLGGL